MKIQAAHFSNTGSVRARNEDGLLIDQKLVAGADMGGPVLTELNGEQHVLIVADGLGGHVGGEKATQTVLKTFRRNRDRLVDDRSLLDVIGKCKNALNRQLKNNQGLYGFGSTTAGIVFGNSHGTAFNCGDCRVYGMTDDGQLRRLTKDHSLVMDLFDQGIIATEEEIRLHPRKNVVTSCLLGDHDRQPPPVFTCEMPVKSGQRFLICSDGVWESMSGAELSEIVLCHGIQEAANILARTVVEHATDNITFIIAEIE